jgi:hypothetical protein
MHLRRPSSDHGGTGGLVAEGHAREPVSPTPYAVLVDDSRAADEFRRIELVSLLERERAIVGQYEQHLAFYRARIEDRRYERGGLDERLGGGSDDGA